MIGAACCRLVLKIIQIAFGLALRAFRVLDHSEQSEPKFRTSDPKLMLIRSILAYCESKPIKETTFLLVLAIRYKSFLDFRLTIVHFSKKKQEICIFFSAYIFFEIRKNFDLIIIQLGENEIRFILCFVDDEVDE